MEPVTPDFNPPQTGGSWRVEIPPASRVVPSTPAQVLDFIPGSPVEVSRQNTQSSAQSDLSSQPSEDDGSAPEAVVDEYVLETGIINEMNTWLCQLSSRDVLQYNPYLELVGKARRNAERFHMFTEAKETVLEKLEHSVFAVDGCVSRTENSPARWGLATTLQSVDCHALEPFDWLLTTMTDESTFRMDLDDQSYKFHRPIAVLVGPSVYTGSFYPQTSMIQIRVECGISGPELAQACRGFAKIVLSDVLKMELESIHIFFGIDVAEPDEEKPGSWTNRFWTQDMITSQQDSFVAAVELSVCELRWPVLAQCMFRLEQGGKAYKRGQKQYNLNFIQTEPEGRHCVCMLPYMSAYDDVFQTHSQAKDYLAWFEDTDSGQLAQETRGNVSGGLWSRKSKKSSSSQAAQIATPAQATQVSSLSFTDSRQQSRGVCAANDRLRATPSAGPYAEKAMQKIRSYFTNKLDAFRFDQNLFNMLHYLILLVVSDRESYPSSVLVEAYRLLHSTAYSLHILMGHNRVLQEILKKFASSVDPDTQMVQGQFLTYRRALIEVFSSSLQERSFEYHVTGKILLQILDDVAVKPSNHQEGRERARTLSMSSEVLAKLESMNRYCVPLMMAAIDDALAFCSELVKLFPEVEQMQRKKSTHTFKHGFEMAEHLNQQRQFLVVEDARKACSAPPSVARETVLLQYFLDTRVDEVFREFLTDILSGNYLPPNPYPRLVSTLRLAAVRMELFREHPSRLIKRLLPGSTQLMDADCFVYQVPGLDAFGTISALSVLDTNSFSQLASKVQVLINNVNTSRVTMSGLKSTVGLAVTGFSTLYGRMSPYLHEVSLEEHYFIQGPRHAKSDALGHFAKLVYDHLAEFGENDEVLFDGIFLSTCGSHTGVKWSIRDVVHPQRRKAFITLFKSVVKAKQRVYMKVYLSMDWRFLLVKKEFLLHFIEGQFMGYERFYNPTNAVAFYQSVFLNQRVASLYARLCGPQDKRDPCSGENLGLSLVHVDHYVELAKADGNLLEAYRWLLVRSLMKQDVLHVIDTWRMLHSTAAQLEYLQSLNTTTQSLVFEELSRTFRPAREDSEKQSSLDREALGTMVEAYVQKLERVLTHGTCVASPRFVDVIMKKMQQVTNRDSVTQSVTIVINKEIPKLLQEVNELLQSLIDTSSWDLHQVCPEMQRALQMAVNWV